MNDSLCIRCVGTLINALSFLASEEVFHYAAQFEKREDYEPLEDLATKIQSLIVREGCFIAHGHKDHDASTHTDA